MSKQTNKVAISLHGREYLVACDVGEEKRLEDIVKLVETKLQAVDNQGGNATETRLFMLTCLLLADELLEVRRIKAQNVRADEDILIAAVDHLRQRVAHIAEQVGRA
jgi:cell division protein ZapA